MRWLKHAGAGYSPRHTFSMLELLAAAGAQRLPGPAALAMAAHLDHLAFPRTALIACSFLPNGTPPYLSTPSRVPLDLQDVMELASCAEAALGASQGFSPAVARACVQAADGGGAVAWRHHDQRCVALCVDGPGLKQVTDALSQRAQPMVRVTRCTVLDRARQRLGMTHRAERRPAPHGSGPALHRAAGHCVERGADFLFGASRMHRSTSRFWLLTLALTLCACLDERPPTHPPASARSAPLETSASPATDLTQDTADRRSERLRMVKTQIEARGVHDPQVLEALRRVPRHAFVSAAQSEFAYDDRPLPIEASQTISQPYIVALMSELAQLTAGERVLEVGTGSGYQAAVLAALGAQVYSIEIDKGLADSARKRLEQLGYSVKVRHGDGYAGWPEAAPFDAIVVTAAPPEVPAPLRAQLAVGGTLVIPVGESFQDLLVIRRSARGYEQQNVLPVRFVPMTGRAQQK